MIGGGDGAWDPETAEAQLMGTSPVLRDTTTVYRYRLQSLELPDGVEAPSRVTKPGQADFPGQKSGWRLWRLRITQPGVWFVHCHTYPHEVQGMMTVWVHGEVSEILSVGEPAVEGYLSPHGSVFGNATHAPRVVHFDELSE